MNNSLLPGFPCQLIHGWWVESNGRDQPWAIDDGPAPRWSFFLLKLKHIMRWLQHWFHSQIFLS